MLYYWRLREVHNCSFFSSFSCREICYTTGGLIAICDNNPTSSFSCREICYTTGGSMLQTINLTITCFSCREICYTTGGPKLRTFHPILHVSVAGKYVILLEVINSSLTPVSEAFQLQGNMLYYWRYLQAKKLINF